MGGTTSVANSQTLCNICNRYKGKNEIDFRCNITQLSVPKKFNLSFPYEGHTATRAITRIVNLFYHCKAVAKVDWEVLTYTYHIYLYPGNNPEWLLQHQTELLQFIQNKLRRHAHNIKVTTAKKI
jgi:hypothetical protein